MIRNIRKAVVELFNNVDGDLAIEIAKGVGVPAPEQKGGSPVTKESPNRQPGTHGTYGEKYH